ncbi:hypothetical protein LCGC14_1406190 [marine sediment metagenome]|uniref:Uncharacterized protein n=1 Tax=marine sediment metagenome TaxID=412755 RepID=A0A0F9KGK3_9ZZZZ
MEIEKTRETSWKIQLKHNNENVEITSVEISGEVRIIKLALLKSNKSVKVEMNKEEFYNFLSLITAFKDVVIGEEPFVINDDLRVSKEKKSQIQDTANIKSEFYQINPDNTEENVEDNESEELNPEEWDPW